MRNTQLLVVGVSGLTNEVCKNLVLAGIGAVTVADEGVVSASDVSTQFFLREEDIGKNVRECVEGFSLEN